MKKLLLSAALGMICANAAFAQDYTYEFTPAIVDRVAQFQFNDDYKYFAISMGDNTKATYIKDEATQYKYVGVDDYNCVLDFWVNSNTKVNTAGSNSFGIKDGYLYVNAKKDPYIGFGYRILDETTDDENPQPAVIDLSSIPEDFKLHMALKCDKEDAQVMVKFYDGYKGEDPDAPDPDEAHVATLLFADDAWDDAEPNCNFTRNGDFQNIDIPLTTLKEEYGYDLQKYGKLTDQTLMSIEINGVGAKVAWDAVFFYGPQSSLSGIKDIQKEDANAPVKVYTLDGKCISKETAAAQKGIYIVKQGSKSKKVVID